MASLGGASLLIGAIEKNENKLKGVARDADKQASLCG